MDFRGGEEEGGGAGIHGDSKSLEGEQRLWILLFVGLMVGRGLKMTALDGMGESGDCLDTGG